MRYLLSLLIILSSVCELLSQQLRVLYQTNHEPVAYASIVYFSDDKVSGGTYNDSVWVAHLNLESNVDQLQISHIKYKEISIDVHNLGEVTYLQPDSNYLEEIVIYPRDELKTSYLGVKKGIRSGGYGTSPGIETLAFLENECGVDLWVESFVFHIKRGSEHNPAIKIVFYQSEKGAPGRIIPFETVHYLGENRKGRIEVDWENEQIIIQNQQAIYVGIEWVGCMEHSPPDMENTDNGCSDFIKYMSKEKGQFYVRNKLEGDEWYGLHDISDYGLTPIFGVEVHHLGL